MARKDVASGRHSGRRGAGGSRACCRWFLALYSDYRDGRLDADARAEVTAHMAECDSCRRYDRVIRTGVAVLRDSVAVEHGVAVEQGEESDGELRIVARRSDPVASGCAVASTLLVIALNGLSSWAPALAPLPAEVEMPPLVAARPSPPAAPASPPLAPLFRVQPADPQPDEPGDEAETVRIQGDRAAPAVPD